MATSEAPAVLVVEFPPMEERSIEIALVVGHRSYRKKKEIFYDTLLRLANFKELPTLQNPVVD